MKNKFRPGDFVEVYSGNMFFSGLLLKFERAEEGQMTFPPVMMASVLVDGQVRVFDIWEGEMHLIIPYGTQF